MIITGMRVGTFNLKNLFSELLNAHREQKLYPYMEKCEEVVHRLELFSGNPHLEDFQTMLSMFRGMSLSLMQEIRLKLQDDSRDYYTYGRIIIPSKKEGVVYHVAEVSLPLLAKQWHLKLYTKEGFYDLESAVSFLSGKGGSLAIAQNTENYPLAETALPIAGRLYIGGYEKSYLKRHPDKTEFETKEIAVDASV